MHIKVKKARLWQYQPTHSFDSWLRGGIRASFNRSFGRWYLRRFGNFGAVLEFIVALNIQQDTFEREESVCFWRFQENDQQTNCLEGRVTRILGCLFPFCNGADRKFVAALILHLWYNNSDTYIETSLMIIRKPNSVCEEPWIVFWSMNILNDPMSVNGILSIQRRPEASWMDYPYAHNTLDKS